MKKSIFILSWLFMATLLACSQTTQQLTADEFEKGINAPKVQILDVRTSGEFQTGHLAHALQADWNNQDQFKDRTKFMDKSKPVYVYCLSGGRSAKAADWLKQQGFQDVYSLKGGINAWKQANKAVENPVPVPQITPDELNKQIGVRGSTLVDFGAEWCPPCREMIPVLEKLQKQLGGRFQLVKVDGGSQTSLMNSLKVEALPTFIVYKNGKETWRKQGITSLEELTQQLQ